MSVVRGIVAAFALLAIPTAANAKTSVAATKEGKLVVATDADTRYMLASLTKQLTAAAVLKLEADGKLAMDDTAGKHLPTFKAGRDVTIRALLSHETTLPDYILGKPFSLGAPAQRETSTAEVLGFIDKLAAGAVATPRTCIAYDNSNYAVLTAIIEAASGTSYGAFLDKEIFVPLGMTSTKYTPGLVTNVAMGHLAGAALPAVYGSWSNGAGAVVSNARDMAKWTAKVASGFLEIPKRVAKDLVRGSCGGASPATYAWGWKMDTPGVLEHAGVVHGYATYDLVDVNRGLTVVVLSDDMSNAAAVKARAKAVLSEVASSEPH